MKKKYFTEEERKKLSREYCKNHKEEKKNYDKKRYEDNKERLLLQGKEYRRTHKKEIKASIERRKDKIKEYYIKNIDKIKLRKKNYNKAHRKEINTYTREYNKKHRKEINGRITKKIATNINFKLAKDLRSRLRMAIKNNQKIGSAVKDLGCSIPELKLHLEVKFQPGMSWNNWNKTGWHIDHIIPVSSFNLQNREEFLKACHYTNLQPMWAEENLKKGDKCEGNPM